MNKNLFCVILTKEHKLWFSLHPIHSLLTLLKFVSSWRIENTLLTNFQSFDGFQTRNFFVQALKKYPQIYAKKFLSPLLDFIENCHNMFLRLDALMLRRFIVCASSSFLNLIVIRFSWSAETSNKVWNFIKKSFN